jgi:hypothetical protein
MNQPFLYACTLLLSDSESGKRALYTHFTIALNDDNALSIATAMANVTANSQTGNFVIEDYILARVDRETLEMAASNILGWEPPPQEIETEQ